MVREVEDRVVYAARRRQAHVVLGEPPKQRYDGVKSGTLEAFLGAISGLGLTLPQKIRVDELHNKETRPPLLCE